MWLASKPDDVSLASLKFAFFAGEPLTASLVARWRKAFPRTGEIINKYGPTETTLAKCFYRVPPQPYVGIQPLGNTLPQSQVLVVTSDRRLCGIGEPGEIALRTPFRSLGYINAREENERRFIANPFVDDPDDKLYLTGDRGAYRADGLLEFLGRLDHQVKIRGVRVEPSEVAAVLQAIPDVAASAVVAREEGDGGPVLVAYVVPAQGARASSSRLRAAVGRRLPAAMVPSAFVFLDSLPLTANQKLDRARLPAPSSIRPSLEGQYKPPRDAVELQLVRIWEQLLDVRPIGVTDSFFELGGHSLMALRLLAKIEQELGTKVPLAAMFETPTVEHLAAVSRREHQGWSRVVSLWPAEHPQKLFLIHPGGGVLWNYIPLVRHVAAQIPIYGLQAQGLDGSRPHQSVEQMASDYIDDIRRLQPAGPYLLAGHSFGGKVAFEMARQLDQLGEKTALLAMFDSSPAPPNAPDALGDARRQDARNLANMTEAIETSLGTSLDVCFQTLCDLATEEQIDYVVDAISRQDALPLNLSKQMIGNLLNVSRAHVQASRGYLPKVSPAPISLFRAQDSKSPLSPGPSSSNDDESLGWSVLSTEPVRVVWTPGDHVTILSEPHVETLARTFRSFLAEAIRSD